jgi:hypothetical protein
VPTQIFAAVYASPGDARRDPPLPALVMVVGLVGVELAGRLRGRPRPSRTPGTASRVGASNNLSRRLAGVRRTPSGMPRRSTTRWRFAPGLLRSLEFGPDSPLPFSPARRRCRGTVGSSTVVPHPRGAPEERDDAGSRRRLPANHAPCASKSCRSRSECCAGSGATRSKTCQTGRVHVILKVE